jgi:hypothetical protein
MINGSLFYYILHFISGNSIGMRLIAENYKNDTKPHKFQQKNIALLEKFTWLVTENTRILQENLPILCM